VDGAYITRRGAEVLQRELSRLATVDRPRVVQEVADAAAQGDRSENAEYIYGKKRLREIDRRIRYLSKRLDELQVVSLERAPADTSRVFFGANVVVEDEDGEQKRYQVVGPDEVDPNLGRISYLSPLGKALLKRRVGEVVTVSRPAGDVEVEIIGVSYEAE
jgi:transcription elongation factor GreB